MFIFLSLIEKLKNYGKMPKFPMTHSTLTLDFLASRRPGRRDAVFFALLIREDIDRVRVVSCRCFLHGKEIHQARSVVSHVKTG